MQPKISNNTKCYFVSFFVFLLHSITHSFFYRLPYVPYSPTNFHYISLKWDCDSVISAVFDNVYLFVLFDLAFIFFPIDFQLLFPIRSLLYKQVLCLVSSISFINSKISSR